MIRLEMDASGNASIDHDVLFRHMDNQYVEAFFDSGSLKLTTYEACRVLEAKETRDEQEGQSWFDFKSPNYGLEVVQSVGMHSYMLCTTTTEPGKGSHDFGARDYFRIVDAVGLSEAIAEALGDVISMRVGPCLYVDSRRVDGGNVAADPVERMMGRLLGKLTPQSTNAELETAFGDQHQEMAALAKRLVANDPFFVKGRHFADNEEVRIVWDVRRKVEGPIEIKCPAATRFCRRA